MTLRSVYSIDVDDAKFKKFKDLFDRYQAAVAKLPANWQQVAAGVGATKTAIGQVGQASQNQASNNQKREDAEKRVSAIARSTAFIWAGITSSVELVDKHLSKATNSLLKWSTITTAFSGLIGAGSLFGIDRLAASVSAQRRSAMGLGIGYGQQNAFNTNYGRLVNSASILSSVSTAKYDMTSPAYTGLLAAGVSPASIRSGNAATIAADLMGRLPGLFGGLNTEKDRGLIGAKAHAYGIDNVMSMQDLIAFLNATPEERRSIAERAAQDARTMDLTTDAQRKWQDFTTQMGRASGRIEVTLMEKLTAIEPGLEKVSDSVVKAVQAFADSGLLKGWIEGLSGGLDSLASYIGTQAFQDKVEYWSKWIGDAASAVWGFIDKIGGKYVGPALDAVSGQGGAKTTSSPSPYGDLSDVHFGSVKSADVLTESHWWTPERRQHAIDKLVAGGVSPLGAAALVSRWANVESAAGPGASNNIGGGHFGIAQWDHSRAGAVWGDSNVDDQLDLVVRELKTSEQRALRHLNAATTTWDAAVGASMYERAGGYNSSTGVDDYTNMTAAGLRTNVVVHSNTANNPVLSGALVANPYTAVGGP